MALRQQIIENPETLSDLEIAAERRFAEARLLLAAGRAEGCVYLCGLAAEMWLKLAALKLQGLPPVAQVKASLAPVKAWMSAHGVQIPHEAYHSLAFWCEFIVRFRLTQPPHRPHPGPLARRLAGSLRHHVQHRLFNEWKVDYRYSSISSASRSARRTLNDLAWLRHNWRSLWR